jgi:hypothetical protein
LRSNNAQRRRQGVRKIERSPPLQADTQPQLSSSGLSSANLTFSIIRLSVLNAYLKSILSKGGPPSEPDAIVSGERRDAHIQDYKHFPNIRNKAQAKRVLQQIKASAATIRAKGTHLTLAEREFLDAYNSVFGQETLNTDAKGSPLRSLSRRQHIQAFHDKEHVIEEMRQDIAREYSKIEDLLTPADLEDTLSRVIPRLQRRKPQPN